MKFFVMIFLIMLILLRGFLDDPLGKITESMNLISFKIIF